MNAKKLAKDVTAVDSAIQQKNGPKTKQTLETAAKDAKMTEKLLAAKGPKAAKLKSLTVKVIDQLKAFAKKFMGSKGPFAKLPPYAKDLTKKVKSSTPK